ncbi:MAG: hypothetical protein KC483_10875 [Nitrosarchaeum sp.]|nr:hypothetical protein [Nitrosarchaeum sp.]
MSGKGDDDNEEINFKQFISHFHQHLLFISEDNYITQKKTIIEHTKKIIAKMELDYGQQVIMRSMIEALFVNIEDDFLLWDYVDGAVKRYEFREN